jgi:hypothetical protein
MLFPITEQGDRQGGIQRVHQMFDLKTICALRDSVRDNGVQAPFTLTILEALNDLWLPPWDRYQTAKEVLPGDLYLQWKTAFGDFAQDTTRLNVQNNVAITFEMLTGSGAFSTLQAQLTYNPQAYEQLSLCVHSKLRELGEPNKCFQGPSEAFANFLDHLTKAVHRQAAHAQAADVLIKQLAYENANADCKKALGPIKEKILKSEFIHVCQIVGSQEHQQVFTAALKQTLSPTPGTCFKCGKRDICKENVGSIKTSHLDHPLTTAVTISLFLDCALDVKMGTTSQ